MRVCLFEDPRVGNLEPLTLTRPAFDLLCGRTSLGVKQGRYFAAEEVGYLVRPHLREVCRWAHPEAPVNDLNWLHKGPTVLVNGRWLPPRGAAPCPELPCLGTVGDEIAFLGLGPDQLSSLTPEALDENLETWIDKLPSRPAGGRLLGYPWDLIEQNAEQLIVDFERHKPNRMVTGLPAGLAVVGPSDRLCVDNSARLDPLVVADTTRGPVVIDREAVIHAFTRLEGPCYVGAHTQVLGAKVRAGTTIGPHCRVGGEVEASILHGYVNKYHDGFLGHSYVGEWVNFGAGTQNSDLRNDYGEVTVTVRGRPVSTGLTKVGCFVGDHTKTGLGVLLNTGSHVGAFCNLLPAGRLLPRWLPSFSSWWNGALNDEANLDSLLRTAGEVMSRRGYPLTEAHVEVYRTVFAQTATERRRAVRDDDRPALRRSA